MDPSFISIFKIFDDISLSLHFYSYKRQWFVRYQAWKINAGLMKFLSLLNFVHMSRKSFFYLFECVQFQFSKGEFFYKIKGKCKKNVPSILDIYLKSILDSY